jgi:hypothetical protein
LSPCLLSMVKLAFDLLKSTLEIFTFINEFTT